MSGCYSNKEKWILEFMIYFNWIVLFFYDFVKKLIKIFLNYFIDSYEFFWGDFVVYYVVLKFLNGMWIICVFSWKIWCEFFNIKILL